VALHVSQGQFTVFFPEDGHIPACAWDAPAEVGKIVVKVRV
jgi:YhcH/YjgK/YiaL family protein